MVIVIDGAENEFTKLVSLFTNEGRNLLSQKVLFEGIGISCISDFRTELLADHVLS